MLAHAYPFPQTVPIKSDDDWDSIDGEGDYMKFRLTYEGYLPAASKRNSRIKHKRRIRAELHPQLRRLWRAHPMLKDLDWGNGILVADTLAENFESCGYNFVPLICRKLGQASKISVLFLRPEQPGQKLIESGDIDNRIKVLFDALQMPVGRDEIGVEPPTEDQRPFFVLLEDDSLISHIEIETDLMLQDVEGHYDENHVRLVMTVETIRVSDAVMAHVF